MCFRSTNNSSLTQSSKFRINIQTARLENSNFAAWFREMAYEEHFNGCYDKKKAGDVRDLFKTSQFTAGLLELLFSIS